MNISKIAVSGILSISLLQMSNTVFAQTDYPIKPLSFTQVQLTDNFWKPKIAVNAQVTIPYILRMCKIHGRVDNFLKAAGKMPPGEKLTDFPFDDTDIYKLIEGASYSLQTQPNPLLDRQIDTLITIIGEAQEKDGYLYTFRTANVAKKHPWIGKQRWVKEEELSHELYNSGHLFEAATAHFQATGKRSLLNIAIKNANLLVNVFGSGKLEEYPGHPVVEMGLVKLYRVTKDKNYLDLAKFFLDIRGPQPGNPGNVYSQSDKKIVDQNAAEGHAVRAAYLYSGIADVAALTGNKSYLHAIDNIWKDVVDHKLYITGGIGAKGNGEAFGPSYYLPNETAYAETCASIANVYWNERMFLLHGDAKYIDILERTLYNGLLSGVSLSGDRFFYPNPLASDGNYARSDWFACACCITNISRFMPSMPEYIYGENDNQIYVNLYVANKAVLNLPDTKLHMEQQTNYPWDGNISIRVNPVKSSHFELHLRIPGWATNEAMPSDLYKFLGIKQNSIPILLNGKSYNYTMEKGYAIIDRVWKKGDLVQVQLPMKVKKVEANNNVKADLGRIAIQRGPIVYCLEGADYQDSNVNHIQIDSSVQFQSTYLKNKLGGIEQITGSGYALNQNMGDSDKVVNSKAVRIIAIPYYSWDNRGKDQMKVWIPVYNK